MLSIRESLAVWELPGTRASLSELRMNKSVVNQRHEAPTRNQATSIEPQRRITIAQGAHTTSQAYTTQLHVCALVLMHGLTRIHQTLSDTGTTEVSDAQEAPTDPHCFQNLQSSKHWRYKIRKPLRIRSQVVLCQEAPRKSNSACVRLAILPRFLSTACLSP